MSVYVCVCASPHNRETVHRLDYQNSTVNKELLTLFFVGESESIEICTLQSIAKALDLHPELNRKTLLLKGPHISIRKTRETKQVLIWKLHPYWFAFLVLNVSIHATKEEK